MGIPAEAQPVPCTDKLGYLGRRQQELTELGKRRASYIAFTCEDETTHEVKVLLGLVEPPKGVTTDKPRYGFPGGGRKRVFTDTRKDGKPRPFRIRWLRNEHPMETAVRETREETGIQITRGQLLDVGYQIVRPNPLNQRRTRLGRVLAFLHPDHNLKADQISYIYIPNKSFNICQLQEKDGLEMKGLQWFSFDDAVNAARKGELNLDVLDGVRVAIGLHKIHNSELFTLEELDRYFPPSPMTFRERKRWIRNLPKRFTAGR